MTTFQESQPQSRRAARQSERGEGVDMVDFTGQQPDSPQVYTPSTTSNDVGDYSGNWSTSRAAPQSGEPDSAPRGRRAVAPAGTPQAVTEQIAVPEPSAVQSAEPAQAPHEPDDSFPPTQAIAQADRPAYRVRDYSPEGRRAAAVASSPWMTAGSTPSAADAAPGSDASAGPVGDAPSAASFGSPAISALAGARPQFFVPESALQDTIVPAAPPAVRPDSAGDIAVNTTVNTTVDAASPTVGADAPPEGTSTEHTMTRRELRALEAQRAAQSAPLLPEFTPDGSLTGRAAAVYVETALSDDAGSDARVVESPAVEPSATQTPATQTPAPEVPVTEAPRQPAVEPPSPVSQVTTPPTLVEPAVQVGSLEEVAADDAVDEVPYVTPALTPFDSLFQLPPAPPQAAPADLLLPVSDAPRAFPAPAIVPPMVVPPAFLPPGVAATPAPLVDPLLRPTPSAANPATNLAPAGFDSVIGTSADGASAAGSPTGSNWSPPTGHWSAQDDVAEDALGDGAVSRTIGSGISTTNALVLPSIPDGADIRGPLTGAGEIMLTGSIDLPRTLASTGQTDRFDGENMDALFDLSDAEVISTDSSPVRAIRAVSTHASAHGVTHTQKPKGTRALTGLLIAASSLAVAVAGLLVAAFAFNVF